MKILHLVLKGEWYDMILSGIKKEEYREIKPFWIKRLCEDWVTDGRCRTCIGEGCNECRKTINGAYSFKDYSYVCFHRGYTSESMIIEIKDISIGNGNIEWGAPNEEVFIIKLGNRLK